MFYKNLKIRLISCEYSANDTTRLTTQKTPITPTLSTSKTNNTTVQSKATPKPSIKPTTPKYVESDTTKVPTETTTTESGEEVTTKVPSTKTPLTVTQKYKPTQPTYDKTTVQETTTKKYGTKPSIETTTTEGREEVTTQEATTRKYTKPTRKSPTRTTTEGFDDVTTYRYTAFKNRTKSPLQTTTTTEGSGETTTINPLGKYPRLGDNNITETGDSKTTTTSVDDLVTLISTITDSSIGEDTTFTTESMERTTTIGGVTKRTRFDTTFEVEHLPNVSTSTEPMEITTNKIVTVTEGKSGSNETTVSVSQTTRKSCKTNKDCGTNDICIKKECVRVCDTNGNVTKTSDDCFKGTCANNYIVMISHLSLKKNQTKKLQNFWSFYVKHLL